MESGNYPPYDQQPGVVVYFTFSQLRHRCHRLHLRGSRPYDSPNNSPESSFAADTGVDGPVAVVLIGKLLVQQGYPGLAGLQPEAGAETVAHYQDDRLGSGGQARRAKPAKQKQNDLNG